ncbi:DUF3311 domain-containing protein [Bacillus sp. UNC438CL73TsuS30]|uniref:DUF3311 domain-containing protein n=1 Tax=Bacillus sp. UNC438CL73TsuS30 TaxID=1340434 RepID=UPI00047C4A45|nr:DUF3311 domain-containing protein [Bacillus sp. UNC438CL73TsuS30]
MKNYHWLAFIPFIGMLGGSILFNRMTPYVLGMPFILFWIVLWVVITSCILAIIFRFDVANKGGDAE